MNPWIILGLVLAFGAAVGGAEVHGHARGASEVQEKWDSAEKDKTIAADKVKDAHQVGTIGVLNHAADTKPDVAPVATVAGRLRDAAAAAAHCPRLPAAAEHGAPVGPPQPAPAATQAADERLTAVAAELGQCVQLAHDYDVLRALWHANEAPGQLPAQ